MFKEQPELSIIVPVHNEVKTIGKVIAEIYTKIPSLFPGTVEVVVCEDGSTDGTKELLSQLQQERKFRLIMGEQRKGYNKAIKDALAAASGKYVFLCDSGGGHEINDFHTLFHYMPAYGVVSGYKTERKDQWHRVFLSRVYNLYVSILFWHRFYDIDCGFKIYKREALNAILPSVHTLKECISTEIVLRIYKKGYSVKEVPVTHYRRNLEGPAKTFTYKKLPGIVSALFLDLLKLKKEIR